MKNKLDSLFFARLFVSEQKQISLIADEKSPARISHRIFTTSCSEKRIIMELKSQEMRKLAPELDPLRIGTGWTKEDLGKVQVMVESTYGDSHPGSGHLNILVEEVRKGIAEEGGFGARYNCTDICDGESQGTDGINYSLASREMIANMIEMKVSTWMTIHCGYPDLCLCTHSIRHRSRLGVSSLKYEQNRS